jgi:hypothetical protein
MNNFNKEQIEAFITNRQYSAAICAFAYLHKIPASELAGFVELILDAEKSSYFYPKI